MTVEKFSAVFIACTQQNNIRFSGRPSSQAPGQSSNPQQKGSADFRACSLNTVQPITRGMKDRETETEMDREREREDEEGGGGRGAGGGSPQQGDLRLSSPFQAKAPVAVLEPATGGSLQISERNRYPLCHRRPLRNDRYTNKTRPNTDLFGSLSALEALHTFGDFKLVDLRII
ncbi:hypothetical protein PoB_007221800 [Plakobranchus ocellatus]|uniref:Uncharacterized protein n=1 Tax=Plakobranchus ocellatus TaxID=259542 RepID=A0AAV4DNS8_9GAST|nr:hypothetical protein PoB_007221800 [Plakobranchus ocellatus]